MEAYIDPTASTGNEPVTWTSPMTGMQWTSGAPTQATEEQNNRVRMILEALKSGVSPESQGVPNSSGLSPVYTRAAANGQPVSLGETPFELAGYRGPGGDDARRGGPLATQVANQNGPTPPADQRSALLNALRTRPQETIQAMSQLSAQLKGIPDFAQKQVYQGLGITDQTPAPLNPSTIAAAAAGHPVPGLSQADALKIMQTQQQQNVLTDVTKKSAEDLIKGTFQLGPKAKLYYNEYGDQANPNMTVQEAQKAGFAERTPDQLKQIPAARSVYFTTEKLRPLMDKLLVKVQQQEKDLPWYTKFMGIQKNRIAMDLLRKSGDTDVRQFDQFVQAGLARYLMALGIPGGRETVALLQRMQVEFPDSSDSREAAHQVLNNVDEMLHMTTGIKKKPSSSGPQVPRVQHNGVWHVKMGNDWYVDPNQQ